MVGADCIIGKGVYKSTDAGETWEHVGLENTGNTLVLDSSRGDWHLTQKGYIEKGTIEGRDGARRCSDRRRDQQCIRGLVFRGAQA